jgi:hypothetical protein
VTFELSLSNPPGPDAVLALARVAPGGPGGCGGRPRRGAGGGGAARRAHQHLAGQPKVGDVITVEVASDAETLVDRDDAAPAVVRLIGRRGAASCSSPTAPVSMTCCWSSSTRGPLLATRQPVRLEVAGRA